MSSKSSDKFKFLHWNSRSVLQRFQDLEKQSANYDCLAISETWLKPQLSFMIKGFDTVRRDRITGRGGGVAILISHSLRYREIPLLEDCGNRVEACAVEILFTNENLILVVCYRPPQNGHISDNDWTKFFSQFNNGNNKHIFVGDFNAHSPLWGSSYTCSVGNSLSQQL